MDGETRILQQRIEFAALERRRDRRVNGFDVIRMKR